MELRKLVEGVPGARITGDPLTKVRGLTYDSRAVETGFLFAAIGGQKRDGNDFVEEAIRAGAVAVLSSRPAPPGGSSMAWVRVENERIGLALLSRNYYGCPDRRMTMIGVTGTNGKTTVCHAIESILREAGQKPCLLGTVIYRYGREEIKAERTTPESLDLYRLLDRFSTAGARSCAMEVSSHALVLHRASGIGFAAAVFTNLTQDHLDFHGSMEAYFEAKAGLFRALQPSSIAILNADDPSAARLRQATRARVVTFGEAKGADVRIAACRFSPQGLEADLEIASGVGGDGGLFLRSPLLGRANARNLAAAAAAALALGVPAEAIARGAAALAIVPGRFERVDAGQPFMVLVDYAHTDDALAQLLAAVRDLKPRRIITVFGCGGERDREKRPKMGRAAAAGSDVVFVTSDNPRGEDPVAIIEGVLPGVREALTGDPGGAPDPARFRVVPDRKEAIRQAVLLAEADDCVVIAGKGHETYQILADRTIPFDDREVVREALRGRATRPRGQAAG